MPHQVTYDGVATPIRPTNARAVQKASIMANYNGSLKAVDCHIHSVRYDTIWCWRVELAAISDASS
eukprot:scaffold22253_cov128-Skeletonema_marinoi.AAC.1